MAMALSTYILDREQGQQHVQVYKVAALLSSKELIGYWTRPDVCPFLADAHELYLLQHVDVILNVHLPGTFNP